MSEEYWIETKDAASQWVPTSKAYSHREAKNKYDTEYNNQKSQGIEPIVRCIRVTWEIINFGKV